MSFEHASPACAEQQAAGLVRQLQENRERLQLIQQAATIGIFEWDIQTGLITWTKEAEALFGLAPGSFGGTFAAWEQCVYPDDLPEARRQVLESVAQKRNLDAQFRVIWPDDGSIHWIYAKARTFYDSHERPLRMLGINIDITDRKNDEEELHITAEKLRLFVESDVIGVAFANSAGELSYVNDAFLQITGYSRAEFREKSMRWADIVPSEWLRLDRTTIIEAQQKIPPVLYEKQYTHKDGSRRDILIGYLLIGKQQEQAVAFVLDFTERKRLERQKDEFIGIVSHELKTPVTSLKVFAQVLHKRFMKSGDHQHAELLAKMDTQIDKLTRLIGDLTDVTKMEAGKLQLHKTEFDLSGLLDEVTEEMQRTTAQHTIRREGVLARTVRADRDRIGQVLTNLLSNAIKYSPHTDTIITRIFSDGEQAIVQVQDFGIGIPGEKQDQIFQRFYRVEDNHLATISGLGLGLYISAEMIKRHGGDIWFESKPGCGSAFSFKLPLQQQQHEA